MQKGKYHLMTQIESTEGITKNSLTCDDEELTETQYTEYDVPIID